MLGLGEMIVSGDVTPDHYAVNRYCLFDDFESAKKAAIGFSRPGAPVEPLDYYVVEVLRKARTTAS